MVLMDKTLQALKVEIEQRFPSARAEYVSVSSGDYVGVSIWGLHLMLYRRTVTWTPAYNGRGTRAATL